MKAGEELGRRNEKMSTRYHPSGEVFSWEVQILQFASAKLHFEDENAIWVHGIECNTTGGCRSAAPTPEALIHHTARGEFTPAFHPSLSWSHYRAIISGEELAEELKQEVLAIREGKK